MVWLKRLRNLCVRVVVNVLPSGWAGLVAYDGSGNGSEGTIANASWLTGQTGAPQLVEGYNRPMWFDGFCI